MADKRPKSLIALGWICLLFSAVYIYGTIVSLGYELITPYGSVLSHFKELFYHVTAYNMPNLIMGIIGVFLSIMMFISSLAILKQASWGIPSFRTAIIIDILQKTIGSLLLASQWSELKSYFGVGDISYVTQIDMPYKGELIMAMLVISYLKLADSGKKSLSFYFMWSLLCIIVINAAIVLMRHVSLLIYMMGTIEIIPPNFAKYYIVQLILVMTVSAIVMVMAAATLYGKRNYKMLIASLLVVPASAIFITLRDNLFGYPILYAGKTITWQHKLFEPARDIAIFYLISLIVVFCLLSPRVKDEIGDVSR